MVAGMLPRLQGKIDIIHAWPLGALHTIRAAKRLGIPVALERCNAHTRFAYEAVRTECDRIGVKLPPGHEHEFNPDVLRHEEAEYNEADFLLCPSDFVVKTFVAERFPRQKLVRFIYGVDETKFRPSDEPRAAKPGLTMIFVGVCAVRKGLHFALEAWLKSPASETGRFLIAGAFVPDYQQMLAPMLAHPSVQVLGHRDDIPELMRNADLFVLPSIEEGFGLTCTEAMASGCVPLISDACTEVPRHGKHGFIHHVGDIAALTSHMTQLHEDRSLVESMRAACISETPNITWKAAGEQLVNAYGFALSRLGRPALGVMAAQT